MGEYGSGDIIGSTMIRYEQYQERDGYQVPASFPDEQYADHNDWMFAFSFRYGF